jgi:hypothetical protein
MTATKKGNGTDPVVEPANLDAAAQTTATEAKTDIFDDVERLRFKLDVGGLTKPELVSMGAHRPGKWVYFRCHPDPEMSVAMLMLKDDDIDGTFYGVANELSDILLGELEIARPMVLKLCVTRGGTPFWWPISAATARPNSWSQSASRCCDIARGQWIRVQSSREGGTYVPHVAAGDFGEPRWPDKTLGELLRIAFGDKFIADLNHPILKKLRGEL